MKTPKVLLRHTVTVEAYEGESAYGPVYAAPVTVRCFVEEKTRTVTNPRGQEVVSGGTFYARLDTVCPAESKVTLPTGRQTIAITANRRDGGGLPTPDHLEVALL